MKILQISDLMIVFLAIQRKTILNHVASKYVGMLDLRSHCVVWYRSGSIIGRKNVIDPLDCLLVDIVSFV